MAKGQSKESRRNITMNDVATNSEEPTGDSSKNPFAMEQDGIITPIDESLGDQNPIEGMDIEAMKQQAFDFYLNWQKEHNERVKGKLDPRYKNELSMSDEYLLVRCLMEELISEDGVAVSLPVTRLPNQDDSGHLYGTIIKNYPLSPVARLVNCNKATLDYFSEMFGKKVKLGDYMYIEPALVQEQPIPGGRKADGTYLPAAFLHPSGSNINRDDQFGYVLLRRYQVQILMNNVK